MDYDPVMADLDRYLEWEHRAEAANELQNQILGLAQEIENSGGSMKAAGLLMQLDAAGHGLCALNEVLMAAEDALQGVLA